MRSDSYSGNDAGCYYPPEQYPEPDGWGEYAASQSRPSTRPWEDELERQLHCPYCNDSGMDSSNPDASCSACRDGLEPDPAFLKLFMLYAYLTCEMDNGLNEQDTSGYTFRNIDDIPY